MTVALVAEKTFQEPNEVTDYTINGWTDPSGRAQAAHRMCERLEDGEILYFRTPPFEFPEEDRRLLLGVRQTGARIHKNISYRPLRGRISGVAKDSPDKERLADILGRFSKSVTHFVDDLLLPYRWKVKLDYASFRPLQELGRQNRVTARNDLLHVDNFPTRPTNGDRILRVFVNINPDEGRRWITGQSFHHIADQFVGPVGLDKFIRAADAPMTRVSNLGKRVASSLGLKVAVRSPYDEFMLAMHHAMKMDEAYQQNEHRRFWELPPMSAWMVYTDSVPHAVESGQYALEQTYMISPDVMVSPEKTPVNVLEKIAGRKLRG